MLCEIITLGSLTFWIILSIFALVMMAEVVYEKFAAAFFTFLVFCVGFFCLTSFKWSWVSENRDTLWLFLIVYVAGAIATSFAKWYFYVRDARDRYDGYKDDFLTRNGLKDTGFIPQDMQSNWAEFLARKYNKGYDSAVVSSSDIIPSAKTNKKLILGWMGYWPFVVFWSLFHDFLRRVWETIYRLSSQLYHIITSIVFRGVDDEIKTANKALEDRRAASRAEQAEKRSGFYKTGNRE